MNRFFINKEAISNDKAYVEGEDKNHIIKVLRLKAGDEVELCDGEGYDYKAVISGFDNSKVYLDIVDTFPSYTEPDISITLYQGIPKSSKMDLIIQKCVEIGVFSIVPVVTRRTVVKFSNEKDILNKTARWNRISNEAAKQSRRGIVPNVHEPMDFYDAIDKDNSTLKIMLWEEEREESLRSFLQSVKGHHRSISVMIGPEGGIDLEEAKYAMDKDWKSVTIGPRILRTETAGLSTLSAIMYQMEEMEWKKQP